MAKEPQYQSCQLAGGAFYAGDECLGDINLIACYTSVTYSASGALSEPPKPDVAVQLEDQVMARAVTKGRERDRGLQQEESFAYESLQFYQRLRGSEGRHSHRALGEPFNDQGIQGIQAYFDRTAERGM